MVEIDAPGGRRHRKYIQFQRSSVTSAASSKIVALISTSAKTGFSAANRVVECGATSPVEREVVLLMNCFSFALNVP
jgi:hypothetical protein